MFGPPHKLNVLRMLVLLGSLSSVIAEVNRPRGIDVVHACYAESEGAAERGSREVV